MRPFNMRGSIQRPSGGRLRTVLIGSAMAFPEENEREPVSRRLRRVLAGRLRSGEARIEAQEVYGREALRRIVRTLPAIERAYASVRFLIMRPKLLSVLDLLLPEDGRILDIGCGFGL